MHPIIEGLIRAIQLIFTADPEVIEITRLSLFTSGSATILSCVWSIPIAVTLALRNFPGRRIANGFFNAMIGFPTVALGLFLYLTLSRSGPIGYLQLLYTPSAIIVGQSILITPIVVSFSTSALEAIDPDLRILARTLGASDTQTYAAIIREASWGVMLAIIAAFNRGFGELGVAMMLGGNIRGVTRLLTTSIALETARGDIPLSISLAIILLTITIALNVTINLFRKSRP